MVFYLHESLAKSSESIIEDFHKRYRGWFRRACKKYDLPYRPTYVWTRESRTMDVQYKTAWVLCHKLREVLADETDDIVLSGEVEIDGCYVGGHVRPANRKEDRVDRRRKENQTGTRRVVIALRERNGRTIPFVGKLESEGVEIARGIVDPDATVFADEGPHWDLLDHEFKTGRVNHSTEYSLFKR